MRNRPICFDLNFSGSARVSRVGCGVSPQRTLSKRHKAKRRLACQLSRIAKSAMARRHGRHARRALYPIFGHALFFAASVGFAAAVCTAQDAVRSTTGQEQTESEPVIVSATR